MSEFETLGGPGTQTITAEIATGQRSQILPRLRQFGIEPYSLLPNISKVLGNEIWILVGPEGVPLEQAIGNGLLTIEGEIEHAWFSQRPFLRNDPFPVADLPRDLPFGTPTLRLGALTPKEAFIAQGGISQMLEAIQAPEAWRWNRGEGAVIFVVDSGVDGRLFPPEQRAGGWTDIPGGDPWEDDFGHGSLVAAIAASDPDVNGFSGVAPRAKVFSLKPSVGPHGGITSASTLQAIDYVLGLEPPAGMRPVANHSFGVYGCIDPLPAVCQTIPVRLLTALDRANGPMAVWAAGNSWDTCRGQGGRIWCGNSLPTSVSVGALGRDLVPQPYSARGPGQCFPLHPTVVAPTHGILPWGAGFRDFGALGGGTSSTAPLAAGALAILLTQYPNATNPEVRAALRMGATKFLPGRFGVLPPFYDPEFGAGLLQIARALAVFPLARFHPSFLVESQAPGPSSRGP